MNGLLLDFVQNSSLCRTQDSRGNPCEDLVYAIQMISELMIYNTKIRYIRWCELVNWIWGDEATGICVVPALAKAGLAGCSKGLRYEYISRAICWCGFLEGASF